jgi:hypothetical protein
VVFAGVHQYAALAGHAAIFPPESAGIQQI